MPVGRRDLKNDKKNEVLKNIKKTTNKYEAGAAGNEIKWDKLDNTAHMYSIVTGEGISNVFRVSVTLKEDIKAELLQKSLDNLLPKFGVFNSRLRQGMFWYYFEENGKAFPKVKAEDTYPCQFIESSRNQSYLFRVSYFRNRINLEVFHVLTDGMGALNFLREITYQYLRYSHKDLGEKYQNRLSSRTSLNTEDSYIRNYRKTSIKAPKFEKAMILTGSTFPKGKMSVMHAHMPVGAVKQAAMKYHASINEYMVAVLTWAILQEYHPEQCAKNPIRICVPVNLRPYYKSVTTKNFFVNIFSEFFSGSADMTFEAVMETVKESLEPKLTKPYLEAAFSGNVSSEKNIMLRSAPLFLKRRALKYAYNMAAKATTATITNLGNVEVLPEYEDYIEKFHLTLSRSKYQDFKISLVSYRGTLVVTVSSGFKHTNLQRAIFRFLASEGIEIKIESNGVYN